MAHREFSSSSSSSNPLIWDRSSSAAQAHTNKIYHHRSNGNSSSSSKKGDLIRWATSIGISLVVFTLVLNNNSTFQLQPYLSDAAKRVYNFCRALVRDVAHSMLSTPPGGRDSPPSSSSSSRTTTVSTTRDHARRRFIAAPHNNNVHSSYSSADVPPHNSQSEKDDDLRITRHQGSCHCAAVAFHIVAPRTLTVQVGSGKIPYPRTLVPAKNFKLRQGKEALETYFVGTSTSAHTFCRQCGVHLLYAPNPHTKSFYLNVDLLQPGVKRRIVPNTDDDEDVEAEVRASDRFPESRPNVRSYTRYSEEPVSSEPFGNITTHTTNAKKGMRSSNPSRRFSLGIVTEEPPSNFPSSREMTPTSNARNPPQQISHLFPDAAVVEMARDDDDDHDWRRRPQQHQQPQTGRFTAVTSAYDFDDDISEPTIPPDLISAAGDAVSIGDCSARSHLTEATAKSLRRYMAKHLRKNNTSSSHQTHSTVTAATTSTSDSIPYDDGENAKKEDEEVYPSYFR